MVGMVSPCHGVSPTNDLWVYAMPQHTGTSTVHNFLYQNRKILNADQQCLHSHAPVFPANTTFTFSFLANPFRRVLSNAFHRGVVNNSKEESVEKFRKFVSKTFCARHSHTTPHCIWVQYSFLNRFPKPIYLSPTSQLNTGFHRVLEHLGYAKSVFVDFQKHHCAASCSTSFSNLVPGTRSHVTLKQNASFSKMVNEYDHIKWYDKETEQRVISLFKVDFAAFNFSLNSDDMWNSRGDPKNLKLK